MSVDYEIVKGWTYFDRDNRVWVCEGNHPENEPCIAHMAPANIREVVTCLEAHRQHISKLEARIAELEKLCLR